VGPIGVDRGPTDVSSAISVVFAHFWKGSHSSAETLVGSDELASPGQSGPVIVRAGRLTVWPWRAPISSTRDRVLAISPKFHLFTVGRVLQRTRREKHVAAAKRGDRAVSLGFGGLGRSHLSVRGVLANLSPSADEMAHAKPRWNLAG
jgi:hypothetical protein